MMSVGTNSGSGADQMVMILARQVEAPPLGSVTKGSLCIATTEGPLDPPLKGHSLLVCNMITILCL